MRIVGILSAVMLVASPAAARDYVPPYQPKSGVLSEGYKHSPQDDGTLRIVTEYRSNDPYVAVNVGLYRAAELAREAGKPYVQILGGYGQSSWGVASGFVFARPSDNPAAPADCKAKRCYTADVAKVFEELGGADGQQPGVPRPTIDAQGRTVLQSGFGIGAIAWADRPRKR